MTRPPELQAIIDAIERDGPYESIEELNRVLAQRMREYNTLPQQDLGGLSPEEMSQLLRGDWISTGALRVSERLPIRDLRDVPFFADARTLLRYIHDAGVVRETPAKNLPRAAVASLLPDLRIPTLRRHGVRWPEERPPRNEEDVPWLPELRYTLLFGGLLLRRKGLRVSPHGRKLLADENAGALYAHLFRTFFQKFDLRALSRFAEHAGLQATIAYSFHRLQSVAREWSSPESLAHTAWLASAKDPPSAAELAYGDLSHLAFRQRVLHPLVLFGLLEERSAGTTDGWRESVEHRVSPLFTRALSFHFDRHRGAGIVRMR